MGHAEHRADAPKSLDVAVLSVSTTRSLATDDSGRWIAQAAERLGHNVVFHEVIPDDEDAIRRTLTRVLADPAPHAVIVTGGTGISPLDVTIEAVKPLFAKELSAFAILFAQLSHEEIGSAAILSRATAGIIGRSIVFCIPGSIKACRLACDKLIFPELGHIIRHCRGN
ncbi:MAG: molybdenum cofactor biosynthesis protein MoaB [Desulfobacteraceae bacterium]|jgi:molybdopterin adenylyltransferase